MAKVETLDFFWKRPDAANWYRLFKRDATNKGLDDYVVWKKRRGATSPGNGMVMMSAHKFWPLMLELAAYRRTEMDAQREFERGFRLGAEMGEGK